MRYSTDWEALRDEVRAMCAGRPPKFIRSEVFPAPTYADKEWWGGKNAAVCWRGPEVETICREEAERALGEWKTRRGA